MMDFCLFLTIFIFCVYSCGAQDDATFQAIVLQRLAALESKVAEQNVMIERQLHVIESLSEIAMRKQDGFEVKTRQSRFVLDSGEGPLGFTVAIAPLTVDHVGLRETIKFETVITDIGGGYNSTTGVFVAPLSGIYMFSCSLLDHWESAHGQDKLHAEIVQNNKVLGRVFAHADNNYRDQGAQTVITQVTKGDRIFVRSVDNKDLGLGGQLFSTFTGYMLMQL